MTPIIYDGPLADLADGFNTVVIPLDGRTSSDLNWKHHAEEAVSKGLGILWEMDLGLFNRLSKPLGNETQLKTLSLALDHFYHSLWPKFEENSVGICLYRGSIDLSPGFLWDDKQQEGFQQWLEGRDPDAQLKRLYCRDVAVEYLQLLIPCLPQSLDPYLFFDALGISNPLHLAQLLDNDRFERFRRIIKGSVVPHRELQWGQSPYAMEYQGFLGTDCSQINLGEPAAVGVYLPYTDSYNEECWSDLGEGLELLKEKGITYRLVSEQQLVADWDGLDYLIVSEKSITPLGKRKLLGFCAAGGTIVTICGESVNAPYETSLSIWLSKY